MKNFTAFVGTDHEWLRVIASLHILVSSLRGWLENNQGLSQNKSCTKLWKMRSINKLMLLGMEKNKKIYFENSKLQLSEFEMFETYEFCGSLTKVHFFSQFTFCSLELDRSRSVTLWNYKHSYASEFKHAPRFPVSETWIHPGNFPFDITPKGREAKIVSLVINYLPGHWINHIRKREIGFWLQLKIPPCMISGKSRPPGNLNDGWSRCWSNKKMV